MNKSLYCVSQEQFDIIKLHSLWWQKEGFPGADPLIPELVSIVNRWPNVVSVWSCEGHLGTKHPNDARSYFSFVATEKGFATINFLFGSIAEKLIDIALIEPTFEIMSTFWADHLWGPPIASKRFYPAHIVRTFLREETKEVYWNCVRDVIMKIEAERNLQATVEDYVEAIRLTGPMAPTVVVQEVVEINFTASKIKD